MNIASSPSSWQPLTTKGVASFASKPWWRLFRVQMMMAGLVTASLVWFLARCWWPVVDDWSAQLPEGVRIRNGELHWQGGAPYLVAEGAFLSVGVDIRPRGSLGGTSDVQLQFRRNTFRIESFLGYLAVPYPRGWIIALGRTEVMAWWGARQKPLLVVVALSALAGQWFLWSLLGVVYAYPIGMFVFYTDRDADWQACWKLGTAVSLPGALLLSVAIALYGLDRLSLIGLLIAGALQLPLSWIYLLLTPFLLPRKGDAARRKDPFRSGDGKRGSRRARKNPFASSR
jgi:hypothetical protein